MPERVDSGSYHHPRPLAAIYASDALLDRRYKVCLDRPYRSLPKTTNVQLQVGLSRRTRAYEDHEDVDHVHRVSCVRSSLNALSVLRKDWERRSHSACRSTAISMRSRAATG